MYTRPASLDLPREIEKFHFWVISIRDHTKKLCAAKSSRRKINSTWMHDTWPNNLSTTHMRRCHKVTRVTSMSWQLSALITSIGNDAKRGQYGRDKIPKKPKKIPNRVHCRHLRTRGHSSHLQVSTAFAKKAGTESYALKSRLHVHVVWLHGDYLLR